jgi:hypothetical protein
MPWFALHWRGCNVRIVTRKDRYRTFFAESNKHSFNLYSYLLKKILKLFVLIKDFNQLNTPMVYHIDIQWHMLQQNQQQL